MTAVNVAPTESSRTRTKGFLGSSLSVVSCPLSVLHCQFGCGFAALCYYTRGFFLFSRRFSRDGSNVRISILSLPFSRKLLTPRFIWGIVDARTATFRNRFNGFPPYGSKPFKRFGHDEGSL